MTKPDLKTLFFLTCLVFCFKAKSQYTIEVLDTNTFKLAEGVVLSKTSFRGLSVVDDQTIWASGSRGTIARSTDGGKTFHYTQLKGYEKSDFRDIEAFDDKRAIVMSSGTPAYILKTIDGGETWKEVYKNIDTAYFLDAMDFWDDKQGVVLGDPINKRFIILYTYNGGESWKEQNDPPVALEGESAFAASGTCIKYNKESRFSFVTGGSHSRIVTFNFCHPIYCWLYDSLNINSGKSSAGAFSIDIGKGYKVIVGGDYLNDTNSLNNSVTIANPKYDPNSDSFKFNGYKSCVAVLKGDIVVACGTSGVDLKGKTISREPFHVVRKAKKGKAVFLAGPRGKIGKLIY